MARENGPIVVNCIETTKRDKRQLDVELGIKNFRVKHIESQYSVVITRFQVLAEFSSGRIEYFEPKNLLQEPLAGVVQREVTSRESEHSVGPQMSGNVFQLLGSLRSKRANQIERELTHGLKVLEVLTAVPSDRTNTVTWLIKLHSPAVLAQYLNGDKTGSVLDYYVGYQTMKARASAAPDCCTSITVVIDCDSIFFLKHRSESRFSAFWESLTLCEMSVKRGLRRRYKNYQDQAFIRFTLNDNS